MYKCISHTRGGGGGGGGKPDPSDGVCSTILPILHTYNIYIYHTSYICIYIHTVYTRAKKSVYWIDLLKRNGNMTIPM